MRPNTPREQLLQNLLAMSSVLLFRSTKLLGKGTPSEREGLIYDIEEWFEESQQSVKAELDTEYAVIPERRKTPREDPIWRAPPPIIDAPIVVLEDIPASIVAKNYFGV